MEAKKARSRPRTVLVIELSMLPENHMMVRETVLLRYTAAAADTGLAISDAKRVISVGMQTHRDMYLVKVNVTSMALETVHGSSAAAKQHGTLRRKSVVHNSASV